MLLIIAAITAGSYFMPPVPKHAISITLSEIHLSTSESPDGSGQICSVAVRGIIRNRSHSHLSIDETQLVSVLDHTILIDSSNDWMMWQIGRHGVTTALPPATVNAGLLEVKPQSDLPFLVSPPVFLRASAIDAAAGSMDYKLPQGRVMYMTIPFQITIVDEPENDHYYISLHTTKLWWSIGNAIVKTSITRPVQLPR